jgi:histidinol dehydrogenase
MRKRVPANQKQIGNTMKCYTYPSPQAEKRLTQIVERGLGYRKKDLAAVEKILADVRKNGDRALLDYAGRFDSPGITAEKLLVSEKEIGAAKKNVSRKFKRSLKKAVDQIEAFHRQQLQRSWIDTRREGVILGQMVHPVSIAGVYVPGGRGGTTPLVSSVLMGAIPARIAGVEKVVMVTPPTRDGGVSPHLLVAADKVGIDAIYKVGSAWSIAALAYGTESIPAVDVIVGPGNIYVTLAKKLVHGTVGIDMIAGPSEILVIADKTADPEFAAADLLSQAEHDPLASAMLVTDDAETARKVSDAVENRLTSLTRKEIATASINKFGAIMITDTMAAAVEIANRIAPEHLELMVADPFSYLGRIRNAGAIFMGQHTPEPVGDYIAGPNHVLPTAGTARFSSALSVDNFTKKTSLINYSRAAFSRDAPDIIRMAETEGLEAHAASIAVRLQQRR